jgi:hypothetical protein
MNAKVLTSTFERKSLVDRGAMFRRALILSQSGDRAASDLLEKIKQFWETERRELPEFGTQSSPNPGMLSALGYHVGEDGVETAVRRPILDYLLTQDALPAIDSLGHMREWGHASEPTRQLKLRWVISNLMHEKWGFGYDKAVREWRADLAYVAKAAGVGRSRQGPS